MMDPVTPSIDEKDAFILPEPVSKPPPLIPHSTLVDAFWFLVNGIATIFIVFLNKSCVPFAHSPTLYANATPKGKKRIQRN